MLSVSATVNLEIHLNQIVGAINGEKWKRGGGGEKETERTQQD